MLRVILLILKILGIILLIAAGLLLTALYAVLFVGISYKIRAVRDEKFQAAASASWLFGVLKISFLLEEGSDRGPVLQVRLLGRPLGRRDGFRGRRKRWKFWKRKTRTTAPPVSEEAGLPEDGSRTEMPVQDDMNAGSDKIHQEWEKPRAAEQAAPPPENPEDAGTEKRKASPGILQKAADLLRRTGKKIKGFRRQIKGIRSRIQKFGERREALLAFWRLEEHRRARNAVWKEVRYLWKHSRPRKIKGQIRFGFADPAHTGLCMGAAGMLCAWYPGTLAVTPDFEQKILKCDILIKGKVRCFVFARILWRLYFNQDIRHMYQHWQEL